MCDMISLLLHRIIRRMLQSACSTRFSLMRSKRWLMQHLEVTRTTCDPYLPEDGPRYDTIYKIIIPNHNLFWVRYGFEFLINFGYIQTLFTGSECSSTSNLILFFTTVYIKELTQGKSQQFPKKKKKAYLKLIF